MAFVWWKTLFERKAFIIFSTKHLLIKELTRLLLFSFGKFNLGFPWIIIMNSLKVLSFTAILKLISNIITTWWKFFFVFSHLSLDICEYSCNYLSNRISYFFKTILWYFMLLKSLEVYLLSVGGGYVKVPGFFLVYFDWHVFFHYIFYVSFHFTFVWYGRVASLSVFY